MANENTEELDGEVLWLERRLDAMAEQLQSVTDQLSNMHPSNSPEMTPAQQNLETKLTNLSEQMNRLEASVANATTPEMITKLQTQLEQLTTSIQQVSDKVHHESAVPNPVLNTGQGEQEQPNPPVRQSYLRQI